MTGSARPRSTSNAGTGVPDRGTTRRQAGRRLWRPGQGQYAAQLLRCRARAAGVHRRSQPAQTGPLPAGRQIPIFAPERIFAAQPDYVFILPWNLKEEIIDQMRGVRDWGGKFVVPIPSLQVI